jgi:drug/metabolite transporter (DMT)-like permease
MKNLGIILLVAGIIMTVFTGFTFVTRKKVVDLGSIEIKTEERTPIYWSPITGALLMAAGVVIVLLGKDKKI